MTAFCEQKKRLTVSEWKALIAQLNAESQKNVGTKIFSLRLDASYRQMQKELSGRLGMSESAVTRLALLELHRKYFEEN